MPGGERGRFVEEEQLREAPGPQQRAAPPVAELEPARDPAAAVVAAADAPFVVVEAATVPVHQAARGVGDELAERRDPVLQRHPGIIANAESPPKRGTIGPAPSSRRKMSMSQLVDVVQTARSAAERYAWREAYEAYTSATRAI